MAKHERFNFRSLAGLRAKIASLGLDIRLEEDLSSLHSPVAVGPWQAPNALGIHPMEGCDGDGNGAPGELTFRRYERYARGGAGLLWFEATAVAPEARANPRQLWLHEGNVTSHARLLERVERASRAEFGAHHQPVTVIQLTQSGRYCKRGTEPAPVIAAHNPFLDPKHNLPPDYPVIADDELEALEDRFVEAARLARRAGFQAVDIKSAHGYLIPDLLAAHTRSGRYGGSFENRTRFLLNIVDKIRDSVPDLLLAVRLSVCDGLEYPYSWGMDRLSPGKEDLAEPLRLVRLLHQKGVRLLNATAGHPQHKPYVSRPHDQPTRNTPVGEEHPLEGIARLLRLARAVQQAEPGLVVMGTGYSWLRQYFPHVAAATVVDGWVRIAGVGREAFAYPDFARDLREKGALDPRKVCTTCSSCTQLMRDGGLAGCVTRDADTYLPIYKQYCRR